MRTDTLKEYVKRVYLLESALYEQNMVYSRIKQEIMRLKGVREIPQKSKSSISSDNLSVSVLAGIAIGFFPFFILLIMRKPFISLLVFGITFVLVTGVVLGFFHLRSHKENQKIDIINQEITVKNRKNQEIIQQKCRNLEENLRIIDGDRRKTHQTLQSFYRKSIIYPKYQNFVAVCSFYEYLSSGRCSSLEGHEGAYNIFENEVRLNMIIMKLDEVISRLDEIRDNQYMLYSAIKQGNQNVNRLTKTLAQTLGEIQNNTAVTAYHSQITAQNTEFLKWVTYFHL